MGLPSRRSASFMQTSADGLFEADRCSLSSLMSWSKLQPRRLRSRNALTSRAWDVASSPNLCAISVTQLSIPPRHPAIVLLSCLILTLTVIPQIFFPSIDLEASCASRASSNSTMAVPSSCVWISSTWPKSPNTSCRVVFFFHEAGAAPPFAIFTTTCTPSLYLSAPPCPPWRRAIAEGPCMDGNSHGPRSGGASHPLTEP
mmetsp:Transcript_127177/g.359944  ORF Transcript_127177/g.359944 Transcript_127177/m.359944 type:complete len:201 (+) Transcript_127177:280-882(+)